MTVDQIRELAMQTMGKGDDFQKVAKSLHLECYTTALEVAYATMVNAEQEVLASVLKDECDFVIMGHYKNSFNLVNALNELVGGSDV